MSTSIKIYTDTEVYDVTPYTTDYQIQLSVMSPYEKANISLRIPYDLEEKKLPFDHAALDVNSWIVIKENDVAVFWGKVSAASYGLKTDEQEPTLVIGDVIRLTCSSWINALQQGQVYLSGVSVGLNGHVFDLNTWSSKLKGILTAPFAFRNVGAVLRNLYNYLTPYYRLPKKLAGGAKLSSIPVVYNQSTAAKFAPQRKSFHRSIFGLAVNSAQKPIPRGTAWSLIQSSFDPDPNLIELFPSLEPAKGDANLTTALGATPCLIYRLKPFQFGAANPPQGETDNVSHPRHTVFKVTASDIINAGLSISDDDRVNAVYVETPLNNSRGIETFGLNGRPVFNREDIDQIGLRMYRGQWPFFPIGRKTKPESLLKEIQYVINQTAEIMLNAHHFVRGTISMRQNLEIKAGSWIKAQLKHPTKQHFLYAYCENITHQTTVLHDGNIQRRTTLSVVRGFYEEEAH